jgi:hypothetical protein
VNSKSTGRRTNTSLEREEIDDHYLAYRKSRPLIQINILVLMSSRASSFSDESCVAMGQANKASQTDRRDGNGSICMNRGTVYE